jgi:hypothetical protein
MKKNFFLANHELYKNGEGIACNIVLSAIKSSKGNSNISNTFTPDTKMFSEAQLTMKDIAYVIYQIRINLLIPFSSNLLFEQYRDATIGDLAHSIWKNMLKAIVYN